MLNTFRQWQYSQQSTCSPELQEQNWLGQTTFCPRPFHAPNSTWRKPVIYRKQCEFSCIGLFLANHYSSRNTLAVPCPASGNIVRSLSWKSPDILQLIWRVLYTIQKGKKKRKHAGLNSTACELSTTCHSSLHYEYLWFLLT